jgi:uncharacterized membrane protein YfcA
LAFIAIVLFFSGLQLLLSPTSIRQASRDIGEGRFDVKGVVGIGFLIGFLGGIVGLILGSLRMPALLRYTSVTTHQLVTTNLLVGVVVGFAGTISHIPGAAPELGLLVVGSLASIPGAILGARITKRLSEPQLLKAIGIILIVTGVAALLEAVT